MRVNILVRFCKRFLSCRQYSYLFFVNAGAFFVVPKGQGRLKSVSSPSRVRLKSISSPSQVGHSKAQVRLKSVSSPSPVRLKWGPSKAQVGAFESKAQVRLKSRVEWPQGAMHGVPTNRTFYVLKRAFCGSSRLIIWSRGVQPRRFERAAQSRFEWPQGATHRVPTNRTFYVLKRAFCGSVRLFAFF